MKKSKNKFLFLILFLCFSSSYCQEKTVYEKKAEELLWQFYKNIGVSQSEIDNAKKTHNTENLNEYIKQLSTTNSGIEKYSYAMLALRDELKKAETLKTEVERKKTESINTKTRELEEYAKSDYSIITKNIKKTYEKWINKSEFEKESDFILRLNNKSQTCFDSICNLTIQNAIENKLYNSKKPELQIGSYNAEKEYFNIKIILFDTKIEDTLNIKYSFAEKFKNDQSNRNNIDFKEKKNDWFISNNNLFPRELIFTINEKKYSKDIQSKLQNIINLNFSSKNLEIKTDLDLSFDYTNYQKEFELNRVHNPNEVDIKPSFPGGMDKFYKFISKNIKYSKDEDMTGRVDVTFTIGTDGSLTDVTVIKVISYGNAEEAIRVLKSSPKWIPGELNGNKVRCGYSLSINF